MLLQSGKPPQLSVACFGHGQSGFSLRQDQVECVIACEEPLNAAKASKFPVQATIAYADVKVPVLESSCLFDEPDSSFQIRAYVIAKCEKRLVALPFDGRCQLQAEQHIRQTHPLLDMPRLCKNAKLPEVDMDGLAQRKVSQLNQQKAEQSASDRYLVVCAGQEIYAIHSRHIKHIMNTRPSHHLGMNTGYFKGLSNFLGKHFPIVELSILLGLENDWSHTGQFTLLIDLAGDSIGLTVDKLIYQGPLTQSIRTGPSLESCRYPELIQAHGYWANQRVNIIDPECLQSDPTILGLIQAGKRLGDLPSDTRIERISEQSMTNAVITVKAHEDISLCLAEVQSVLDLNARSELIFEDHRIKIDSKSDWLGFYDLGQLVYNRPRGQADLRYALVVQLDNQRRIALGVENLGGIYSSTWKASVPRLGRRPANGYGKSLEMVEIQNKGLVRRINRTELTNLVTRQS